jgi:hypothetical protein
MKESAGLLFFIALAGLILLAALLFLLPKPSRQPTTTVCTEKSCPIDVPIVPLYSK